MARIQSQEFDEAEDHPDKIVTPMPLISPDATSISALEVFHCGIGI
jgi:hypothetical protein